MSLTRRPLSDGQKKPLDEPANLSCFGNPGRATGWCGGGGGSGHLQNRNRRGQQGTAAKTAGGPESAPPDVPSPHHHCSFRLGSTFY